MITFNLKEINRDDEQDQAKMIIHVSLTDQQKKHDNKSRDKQEEQEEWRTWNSEGWKPP